MTTFAEWIRSQPGRCPICGFDIEHQGCACDGTLRFAVAAKAEGQSRARVAHPTEAARVEAAIRQLAATGRPFSANDARALHGCKGGVVGATFTAMRTKGVIRLVGSEASSKQNTHAHHVGRWIGVAA